ncbi:hypothetical protein BT63DRAFT_455283 [Microthyrium microscopicum]|uniref:Mitochondrial import inner membrane translocase subunit n=1 Tax=Microthyrium microscopicum TaxID=703497 RepID=A0A6A6UCE6_9PEZI|nr:hypothetical protein BT63DRAFT_455283 [Microthyrium microscopicum]
MSNIDSVLGGLGLDARDRQELEQFHNAESQKAMIQGGKLNFHFISKLTGICFKKCVAPGPVSSSAISRTEETCMRDCVNRFMEVQNAVLEKATKS